MASLERLRIQYSVLLAFFISVLALAGLLLIPGIKTATLEEHGAIDWIGHLLTALIIALGLRALRLPIPVWLR